MSSFLKPYESGLMQAWPVSTAVNKASNQGKQLIEPVAATCAARGHMQQGVANKENRYKLHPRKAEAESVPPNERDNDIG